ncbi:hypothetical protein DV735_g2636, partial [Chaetothyriales sp. CBS 134920]
MEARRDQERDCTSMKSHRANLGKLVQKALRGGKKVSHTAGQADVSGQKEPVRLRPDFISVTRGPGMHSNLSCGLDTAKGLAAAFDVPLIGVNHMQAHALTPRLMYALEHEQQGDGDEAVKPAFPFLTLLVSGGHTMLLQSDSLTSHSILANTMDIAIGDCLDKCGRAILPDSIKATTSDTAYGKHLSRYAFAEPSTFSSYPIPVKRSDEIDKAVNEYGWRIQPALGETRKMAFSYAGFVSHVQRIVASKRTAIDEAERLALARAALGTAFEHLCSRLVIAIDQIRSAGTHLTTLVVSGGVAANDFLRYFLRAMLDARGFPDVQLVFPPISATFSTHDGRGPVVLEPCTDNAAMIAWAGMEMYTAGWYSDLGIHALPKWSLDAAVDGGIAGLTSKHADAALR